MGYIIALIICFVLYAIAVKYIACFKQTKIVNFLFCATVFALYFSLSATVYSDVGFNDWNFKNTLPVANVSPFMFSIMPLVIIAPKKIRGYLFALISLLSFGMLVSPALGCIYNASINYKFHFHFLLDYVAHFLLSLFGIYLVRTKQVILTKRTALIGGSIIVSVAFVMLVLNLIFDTSFFGLSLRGKHNIYNSVLVENSYLSCALYFAGLIFVLIMGFVMCNLLSKKGEESQ